eukprot:TRINITY_DN2089_c0_g1_i3.p1 TRINITY_DN2089_c0_g1~~TRINITY_DN2089_c0_g1_i3.p1  ORF type:complete len:1263 (-),score=254.68 TRINITY_DN2089_c0_g1_i3:29-3772(-)
MSGFALFKCARLLEVSADAGPTTTTTSPNTTTTAAKHGHGHHAAGGAGTHTAITQCKAAHGSGHTFVAVGMSTSDVFVRYVGSSGVPEVKCIRWLQEFGDRLTYFCWSDSAEYLLLLSYNGCVTVFPTASITTPPSSLSGRGAHQSGIHPNVIQSRTVKCTSCLWWQSFSKNKYVIVGSDSMLLFLALSGRRVAERPLKGSVKSMELLTTKEPASDRQSKWVVVKTSSSFYRVLLEQTDKPELILDREKSGSSSGGGGLKPFHSATVSVSASPQQHTVQVIFPDIPANDSGLLSFVNSKGEQTLGVLHQQDIKCYGSDTSRPPLNSISLPVSTRAAHVTDRLTYTVSPASAPGGVGHSVFVVSNHVATGGFNHIALARRYPAAILQEFALNEEVKGFCRCADVPESGDGTLLEGCYFFSDQSLFECRLQITPERLFFSLIQSGHDKDAKSLVESLNIHQYTLYEKAADQCYENKQYGRAHKLYSMSLVKPNKYVTQFARVQRVDCVITYLKQTLASCTLTPSEQRQLSDWLFSCFLVRLTPTMDEGLCAEFSAFLSNNEHYSVDHALSELVSLGYPCVRFFLQVAKLRNYMAPALRMLCERGIIHLSTEDIQFTIEAGFSEQLKQCTPIFRTFPSWLQVELILSNPATSANYVDLLARLLDDLDQKTLLHVVGHFDPSNPPPAAAARQDAFVELYLRAYIRLERLRAAGADTAPPMDAAAAAAAQIPSLMAPLLPTALPPLDSIAAPESVGVEGEVPPSVPTRIAARMIVCGSYHVVLLTSTSDVFTWGNNTFGQLGHGHTQVASMPQLVAGLRGAETQAVVAGGGHSFAIAHGGVVWAWGENANGQLGLSSTTNMLTPCKVALLHSFRVCGIGCGAYHTLFLADTGSVYACGQNDCGQLGVGGHDECLRPTAVPLFEARAMRVACGSFHSCACTDSGDVYTWGSGKDGQLGHGNTSSLDTPYRVKALSGTHIADVFCGSSYTMALSDLSGLYSWGEGGSYQLGHGEKCAVNAFPRIVSELADRRIQQVACGQVHSLALCASGDVFAWGFDGSVGCLGLGAEAQCAAKPTAVLGLAGKHVEQVSCGEAFSVALTKNGDVYSWGFNAVGQLGLGNLETCYVPTLLEIRNAPLVTSSSSSKSLLQALEDLFGHYRPFVIVRYAAHWRSWLTVAVVYELMGEWQNAATARLQHIEETVCCHRRSGVSASNTDHHKEADSVLDLASSYFDKFRSEGGHVILLMVSEHTERE